MNIDIRNYGRYRLTSHSGRRFDLYNRDTGDVLSVHQKDFDYIVGHDYPFIACFLTEDVYPKARKSKGIDVA